MKTRLDKLLLCGLIACALALPVSLGEEAALPTEAPTAEATAEPTQEPTSAPTPEPTQDPAGEATAEPTAEPTLAPSPEATAEPTPEQSPEVTPEPTLEPTAEPTPEPTPSATPDAGTTALPDSIGGLVHITPENGMQQEDGSWSIALTEPGAALAFSWTVDAEAQKYFVYRQETSDSMRLIAETAGTRIELPSADYANGQFTLYLGAQLADGSMSWGRISFALATQQGGFPGGMGGQPGGSGGAAAGGMPEEEQGFRIVPGEALTSKHASGTMDTTAYTHSEIISSDEAISELTLESTQSRIALDGGAFYATVADGALTLTPEDGGDAWRLSALAMKTLANSGVETVHFQLGDAVCSLSTNLEFSGSAYASLRAQGYVSKDMELQITAQGVYVHVAGGVYAINESGELTLQG